MVDKNGKCQGGVHFFINIFTITQELDAKWEAIPPQELSTKTVHKS